MNQKTAVKVCGITHPEEARNLDSIGVDYLGFNFYPKSKRYIAPEQASEIIRTLKSATPVGVFVDEPLENLREICKQIFGLNQSMEQPAQQRRNHLCLIF